MKKIKLLLDPNDIELISDALNTCFDNDDVPGDQIDTFENLCQMFNILRSTGKCLKVSTDEDCDCCECDSSHDEAEKDEPLDDETEWDDEVFGGDDDNDPDAIDLDEGEDEDEDDKPAEDKSNIWNANTPWTT